jgi:hypothetical protein
MKTAWPSSCQRRGQTHLQSTGPARLLARLLAAAVAHAGARAQDLLAAAAAAAAALLVSGRHPHHAVVVVRVRVRVGLLARLVALLL